MAEAGLIRNKDFHLQIFVKHSKSLKKKQKANAECDVTYWQSQHLGHRGKRMAADSRSVWPK